MKVKVLYFSSIKDKIKKSNEHIEINGSITLNEFLNLLSEKYPEIKDNLKNVMLAVNEEYKDKNYTLKDGDVIAIIPPVSGG